jgi:CubicO group peptidase (beta-lactamase class C family)
MLGAATLAACAGRDRSPGQRSIALASEIDAAVERAMTRDLAPGLGVAVYSREGTYARGFGLTDIQTREPVAADTAFYVASSTKSMTALTLASLSARGELNLDATLAEFAPDAQFPPATRASEVRMRHLLAHVGGIANDPIQFRFTDSGQHAPDTLWRLLAVSQPNAVAPLGTFQYTNTGYNITTILTDRKLGVRWQDLLQRELFDPAGMTRTTTSMSRGKASGWSIAKPHVLGRAGVRERNYLEKTDQTMHSAGGVIMSARDAVKWLELMIEDGRVGRRRCVPAEVVQGTRTPIATVNVDFEGYRREHYGLGWYIGPYRDERMLHHFGGFSGTRAHVSYLPDQAIGVAAFTNQGTVGLQLTGAVANYFYDRVGGYADAQERFDAALNAAKARYVEVAQRVAANRGGRENLQLMLTRPRSAYAGVYENADWGSIEVAEEGESLRVAYGVMHAAAEPAGKTDAVRVELQPGEGGILQFEGADTEPDALSFEDRRFRRAGSA